MTTISEPQSCCDGASSSSSSPVCSLCSGNTPASVTVQFSGTSMPGGGNYDGTYTLNYLAAIGCAWSWMGNFSDNYGLMPAWIDVYFTDVTDNTAKLNVTAVGAPAMQGRDFSCTWSKTVNRPFNCASQQSMGSGSCQGTAQVN